MKRFLFLSSIVCFFLMLAGCDKDNSSLIDSLQETSAFYTDEELQILSEDLDLPEVPYNYSSPFFFGGLGHKATLGRVLFYDKKLSIDGKISCASCHHQELAFSDNKAFSDGPNGNITKRNSIALGTFTSFASRYNGGADAPQLFWDERASTVRQQLEETIMNPDEMGTDLDQLIGILNEDAKYRVLFNKAFGSEDIDKFRVLGAIEDFVNSLTTNDAKFDRGHRGDIEIDYHNYTAQENLGKSIFVQNCNSCHGATLLDRIEGFPRAAQNGITINEDDLGVGALTNRTQDRGIFKVPSLRNVALTGPYMHDGRFATLAEVVDHYNSGMKNHPNLHPLLKDGAAPVEMNLSDSDKAALIAFLHTLTDETILKDEKWSDPFID